MNTREFIEKYGEEDIASVALKIRQYPDVDAAFALQQIGGRQCALHKLPTIASIEDWHWAKRLNIEQCSGEKACLYKRQIAADLLRHITNRHARAIGADLTGGLGADTVFLSTLFSEWHYVEKDAELCRLAEHNFNLLTGRKIIIHNQQAEEFAATLNYRMEKVSERLVVENVSERLVVENVSERSIVEKVSERSTILDFLYIDPARRDKSGNKVFRIADCTPDIAQLYPTIRKIADIVMIKLSPMLDINDALNWIPETNEVHIVATQGEVKEVLLIIRTQDQRADGQSSNKNSDVQAGEVRQTEPYMQQFPERLLKHNAIIHAVDILNNETIDFAFTAAEEQNAVCPYTEQITEGDIIFEPNAAILKAGAFRLIAQRYNLLKAAPNTHIYKMYEGQMYDVRRIPGRIFRVEKVLDKKLRKTLVGTYANIICRNYPVKADELKKQLRTKDGGDRYIIGIRIGNTPTLLLCTNVPLALRTDVRCERSETFSTIERSETFSTIEHSETFSTISNTKDN